MARRGYTARRKGWPPSTAWASVAPVASPDSGSGATTGTSAARASFVNPEGTVRAGQFVRVELKGAVRLNALVVPQKAVLTSQQGKMVWVVGKDNTVEARPLQISDSAKEKVGDQLTKNVAAFAKLARFSPYVAGDTFTLERDVPHSERYGAQGAAYWVARRNG